MTARGWLLAAGLLCLGAPADAQTVCHQRAKFVTELGRNFLETPTA
jgi:uncharacterized membrane protein YhhN